MNRETAITIKATALAHTIIQTAVAQEVNGSLWEEHGDGEITPDDADAITKAAEFVIPAPASTQIRAATAFLESRAEQQDAETRQTSERESREFQAAQEAQRRVWED